MLPSSTPQRQLDRQKHLGYSGKNIETGLLDLDRFPVLQDPQIILAHAVRRIRIEKLVVVITDDFFNRRIEALAQQAVGKQVAALYVFRIDVRGDVFQNIGKQFLAVLECLVGITAPQRDFGQVGGLLDQPDFLIGRPVRLAMVDCEGAEYFPGGRCDRFRPARPESCSIRQFPIGRPVRMGEYVFDDDALPGIGCRAAGTGADADLDSVDRVIV